MSPTEELEAIHSQIIAWIAKRDSITATQAIVDAVICAGDAANNLRNAINTLQKSTPLTREGE